MLKPYHEHPLLQNYSSNIGPTFMRADWYCQHCGAEIKGPPFELGEYVVEHHKLERAEWVDASDMCRPYWAVYMRSQLDNPERVPLFETSRKRDAVRHARQLEARRCDILRALEGDKASISENFKEVEKLRKLESDS